MKCENCIHLNVCAYTHQPLPLTDIIYNECDHIEDIGCPFINKEDVAPVIYAKWEYIPEETPKYRCSNCKKHWSIINTDEFCSHCGANMINHEKVNPYE